MARFFIALLFVVSFVGQVMAQSSMADVQAAVMKEEYKKAKDLIAKELASGTVSPENKAQAKYYLGLCELRMGEYARAQETFKKLVAEKPGDDIYDKASVGVIDTLYMQGYYEKALKQAMALIDKRRKSEMMSVFYLKVARANLKLARWSKAQEYLQKITAEFPDSLENGIARQLLEEKEYFTIQVGAFLDKSRAEQLVKELTNRKEYAYIVETRSSDSRTYYRVRVGQLSTLQDAQKLEAKLAGLGYPTLIYP